MLEAARSERAGRMGHQGIQQPTTKKRILRKLTVEPDAASEKSVISYAILRSRVGFAILHIRASKYG